MAPRDRTEIPQETAAQVLFESDRTCCVCRQSGKGVQIHHMDGDPSNNSTDNLAVLCLECHHLTQTRGGFDRKLDAAQVALYKKDWVTRVAAKRETVHGPIGPGWSGEVRVVKYLKTAERSEEHLLNVS